MPSYVVCLSVSASTSLTIEADSPEEAAELAEVEACVTLCHQCGGELTVDEDFESSAVLDDSGEVVWERTAAT